MKRSAFRIYCPYAGQAPGGTISGRRPLPRVPWPNGITVQLVPESKIDCASQILARSLFVQLKHAQTSLRPPAAFQARIGHRGYSGFVQTKLVRAVLYGIEPIGSEIKENRSGRALRGSIRTICFILRLFLFTPGRRLRPAPARRFRPRYRGFRACSRQC